MQFLIILAILMVVVLVVTVPLRRVDQSGAAIVAGAATPSSQLADLEAAREAKYREIRDADLDHRTGKLSDADYEALDQVLRAEAIEILRAIDRAQPR